MIDLDSVVSVPPDVLFREVGGEAVLLHLGTGKYYGLNEVGARMWQLLSDGHTLLAVVDVLAEQFSATKEQLRGDVVALVERLAREQLLIRRSGG